MGIEIEKKFLLNGDAWQSLGTFKVYRQGYLSVSKERIVRVRTIQNKGGDEGYITIKGNTVGATRLEYEYEIPFIESQEMLDQLALKPILEKERYTIEYKGFVWEVDRFLGNNKGLVVAEVELESEDQVFEKPDWIGREVTGDPKYYNSNLVKHPFSEWKS